MRVRVLPVLLVLTASLPALAAPSTSAKREARAHFDAASKLYQAARYDQSIVEYQKAYAVLPLPDLLFNIAQAYRLENDHGNALIYYQRYLDAAPDGRASDEAKQRITELTPVPAAPAVVEVAPPPSAHVSVAVLPSSGRPSRTLKIAGVTLVAVGVVGLALGGAFTALASSANHDYLHPSDGVYSADAENRRSLYQGLDSAFFAVGGAALVAGVTTYLIGQHQSHSWSLAPVVTTDRVALTAEVHF